MTNGQKAQIIATGLEHLIKAASCLKPFFHEVGDDLLTLGENITIALQEFVQKEEDNLDAELSELSLLTPEERVIHENEVQSYIDLIRTSLDE